MALTPDQKSAFQAVVSAIDNAGTRAALSHLWDLLEEHLGFDGPTPAQLEAERQAAVRAQIAALQSQLGPSASPDASSVGSAQVAHPGAAEGA